MLSSYLCLPSVIEDVAVVVVARADEDIAGLLVVANVVVAPAAAVVFDSQVVRKEAHYSP